MIEAQLETDYQGYDKISAGWGINNGSIKGFFVTKEELEQLQREAFRAGRAGTNDGEGYIDYDYLDEDEYLSSKSKEGAE